MILQLMEHHRLIMADLWLDLVPAEKPGAFATMEGNEDELQLAISRHLHRPVPSFQLISRAEQVEEVAINGISVARLFGVLPPDIGLLVPVFVGPWETAQHVRVVMLQPMSLTLRKFLACSNVSVRTVTRRTWRALMRNSLSAALPFPTYVWRSCCRHWMGTSQAKHCRRGLTDHICPL